MHSILLVGIVIINLIVNLSNIDKVSGFKSFFTIRDDEMTSQYLVRFMVWWNILLWFIVFLVNVYPHWKEVLECVRALFS